MSVSFPLSLSDQKLEKGLCPRRWSVRSITDLSLKKRSKHVQCSSLVGSMYGRVRVWGVPGSGWASVKFLQILYAFRHLKVPFQPESHRVHVRVLVKGYYNLQNSAKCL